MQAIILSKAKDPSNVQLSCAVRGFSTTKVGFSDLSFVLDLEPRADCIRLERVVVEAPGSTKDLSDAGVLRFAQDDPQKAKNNYSRLVMKMASMSRL